MPRNMYPPNLPAPSNNTSPRPTYPRPTFHDSYTPGQSAYTATRNSYITDQSAYGQHQRHTSSLQRESQNTYTPIQENSCRLTCNNKADNSNNATCYNSHSPSIPHNHNHNHDRGSNRARNLQTQILDDQIAPAATSHSIQALQRFAHATAAIPACPPRRNEVKIVARIEARYGTGIGLGTGRWSGGVEEGRKRGWDLVDDEEEIRGKDGNGHGKRRWR